MKYKFNDPEASAEIIKNEILKSHRVSDEDNLLTTGQVLGLILEKCEVEDDEYLCDDDLLKKITDTAQSILLGSMLSRMASEGELECYWDDKKNDMIWLIPKST